MVSRYRCLQEAPGIRELVGSQRSRLACGPVPPRKGPLARFAASLGARRPMTDLPCGDSWSGSIDGHTNCFRQRMAEVARACFSKAEGLMDGVEPIRRQRTRGRVAPWPLVRPLRRRLPGARDQGGPRTAAPDLSSAISSSCRPSGGTRVKVRACRGCRSSYLQTSRTVGNGFTGSPPPGRISR